MNKGCYRHTLDTAATANSVYAIGLANYETDDSSKAIPAALLFFNMNKGCYHMTDEAVSRYLNDASSKKGAGAIDFFNFMDATSRDRGSMSAAWLQGVDRLKNISLKRRLKAEWEATTKARKGFWDRLDEQERDEVYCKNLEVSVVEDKLYVAEQHSSRIQRAGTSGTVVQREVHADAINQDQDVAARLPESTSSDNKRRQSDVLAENPQEQDHPQQRKKRQQRHQQHPQDDEGPVHRPFFDPATAIPSPLEIEGVDIGNPFRRLQDEAAAVVNDVKKTLTLEFLPFFLAANHIWDATYQLPGMSDDDHDTIQGALHVPVVRLSEHLVLFSRSLGHDMTSKGYIRSRETQSREQDALLVLLQQASQKLPRKFLPFKHLRNEDTHAHSVLDSLFTFVFPAYHQRYELHWANRASNGSSERRKGDAYKPDATVLRDGFELGFMEMKPPREERHQRAYLEDMWALSGFAKDAIDLHLRHSRILTAAPCVHVFGFQMTLYQLTFQNGIYVWQSVHASYLPRDQYDSGNMMDCVELLKTFKAIMDESGTERKRRGASGSISPAAHEHHPLQKAVLRSCKTSI
ncbi:hypothetical protein KI688_004196 [Linnemannia hyalina]|uniref:Uncharacterized protein n=1 Tax=Linnemannia hyalina TaxID=64524 RepID=A0A9P7XNU9_9FUNG|nr:hypothetical protein KI688_004196 [Linnemannia hyalina]